MPITRKTRDDFDSDEQYQKYVKRRDQSKEYYQKNKEKLKNDSTTRYFKNHEKNLEYRRNYYYDNREEQLQKRKEYTQKHKIEQNKKHREYYQTHKESIKIKNKRYREKNRERVNKQKSGRSKILQQERKRKIIEYYSKGKNCCNCCGESIMDFLALDHIEGGGGKHRNEVKSNFYQWIIKNDFPVGFQILCHNCNMGKRDKGICPHKSMEKK